MDWNGMECWRLLTVISSGRGWSDNGPDSTTIEPVCGGSLATEGVRTALAQLLNFHGINVNGLENTVAHHPTQNSGGKWY